MKLKLTALACALLGNPGAISGLALAGTVGAMFGTPVAAGLIGLALVYPFPTVHRLFHRIGHPRAGAHRAPARMQVTTVPHPAPR